IAMAYITGRRPGEIVRLDNDPVAYDSAGDPYLIWYRLKNGGGTTGQRVQGTRIPLSPEAVQLIRDWQEYQLANSITSDWMFPNVLNERSTKHIAANKVTDAVKALVKIIPDYTPAVEGASGAMLNFNLDTLDAYCFRHGFAQRHADAIDEYGHRLFEPRVLQELMDHRHSATTAGYYEITARDLKQAVSRVPIRQFDIFGKNQPADQERSDFTPVPGKRGGHCVDPQVMQGRACPVDEDCELCTNYRVDVTERRSTLYRQDQLRVQKERMILLGTPQIKVDCTQARIDSCQIILDAIDYHLDSLDDETRAEYERLDEQLAEMEDGFRVHTINLRDIIKEIGQ
ncbi:MAG: tyrosine-type recombinase/integrase, partial [Actinobacteria bacterium]|nr:tyrosine-type recombinase/integrase [Actinomycetota bacterium]